MSKIRLVFFAIFLVVALAFLGADIYVNYLVIKAKNDELTEEITATLNADPVLNKDDGVYMLSLAGSGDRFKVYYASILELKVFETLKQGDTIVYRTYKESDLTRLLHLGDVTLVASLGVGDTEVVSFSSFYDAMHSDYTWMQWVFSALCFTFFCLSSLMLTLHARAKRRALLSRFS